MRLVTDKFWTRFFFFCVLLICFYNYIGHSLSFSYVQGFFGVSFQDANWLLRGFHAGTIITGIAGLVFIKWLGNRWLFIGSALAFLIATIISFKAVDFTTLLIARIAAGIANGFMIAVATQLFLATYTGKEKVIGALISVAANIAGLCVSLVANSVFTEDFGWQFNYFLSVPVLIIVIIAAFFFVPVSEKNQEIEEDWISLIPFSILIIATLFFFMYRQQYQGISHPKILVSLIIVIVTAAILLIRGATHRKPLFDTRLLQYPAFPVAVIISFLTGVLVVFSLSMITKLLGGILQMPAKDIYYFVNFLALVLFISLITCFILIVKKCSVHWLMIAGFLCIAFGAYELSQLNTELSLNNIVTPALVGMMGAGIVTISVIVLATKTVPPNQVGKVANFRSVAFLMGIAITASDLGRIIDFGRVRNFNSMMRYADPSNPQFQERLNGLQSMYLGNGYDPDEAYEAAVKGVTGMIKTQAYFKSLSQAYQMAVIVCFILIVIIFILWVFQNYRMLIDFITFKNKANENAKTQPSET